MIETGSHVIVRADRAGIVYGTLGAREDGTICITGARQIWSWADGAALCALDLAARGVGEVSSGHRISAPVSAVEILAGDIVQMAVMSPPAVASLDAVEDWAP